MKSAPDHSLKRARVVWRNLTVFDGRHGNRFHRSKHNLWFVFVKFFNNLAINTWTSLQTLLGHVYKERGLPLSKGYPSKSVFSLGI